MSMTNTLVNLVGYYHQIMQFALKMEDEFKVAQQDHLLDIPSELIEIAKKMHDKFSTHLAGRNAT